MLATGITATYAVAAFLGNSYCVWEIYSQKNNAKSKLSVFSNGIVDVQLVGGLIVFPFLIRAYNAFVDNMLSGKISQTFTAVVGLVMKSMAVPLLVTGGPLLILKMADTYDSKPRISRQFRQLVTNLTISYVMTSVIMRICNYAICNVLLHGEYSVSINTLSAMVGTFFNSIFMLQAYDGAKDVHTVGNKAIFIGCNVLFAALNVGIKNLIQYNFYNHLEDHSVKKAIFIEGILPTFTFLFCMMASISISIVLRNYSINRSTPEKTKEFQDGCNGMLYSAVPHAFCQWPL